MRSTALGLAIVAATSSQTAAQTLPTGAIVGSQTGVAVGAPVGNTLTVTQTTPRAVIDWTTFNVGSPVSSIEKVLFNHTDGTPQSPGNTLSAAAAANYITLNRVGAMGGRSDIYGQVKSILNGNEGQIGGQIWILNPNGLLIGSTGQINARGFLGTTHGLLDDNAFLSGNNSLTFGNQATTTASVTNLGRIEVSNGGYAVLAGRLVSNGDGQSTNGAPNGLITANLGTVVLGGVPSYTLNLDGQSGGLLSFVVPTNAGEYSGLPDIPVNHRGEIKAVGGTVLLTARAASGIVGSVVNVSGIIDATTTLKDAQGNVILSAATPGRIAIDGGANGIVKIADEAGGLAGGVLDATSAIATNAGSITVLGHTIEIGTTGRARLFANATGPGGALVNGGTISIGAAIPNDPILANAPLARSIKIGMEGVSNFDRSNTQFFLDNPTVFPVAITEIAANAFGGSGRTGGTITLRTASNGVDPSALISTSGFISAQSTGTGALGGTIEAVTQSFLVRPSGTLTANAVGSGSTGGIVRVAGQRLEMRGDHASAPESNLDRTADTRISASGGIAGGTILWGGGLNGAAAVEGEALASEIWIESDSSFRASASTSSPSTGGTIVIRGVDDGSGTGSSVYIDGGLSARGGNGGHIETVGQRLQITGATDAARIDSVRSGVDAGGYASDAVNGTWLISGSNLTIKGVVTPGTPDFLGGIASHAIDARVLGGALGTEINGPLYGATNLQVAESRFGAESATKLSVLGPIAGGATRDVSLQLSSSDEVDLTGAITADSNFAGKLNVTVSAGNLVRYRDDGQQGPGVQAIFTNGGSVNLSASNIEVGGNRAIATANGGGTAAGNINIIGGSSGSVQLHDGADISASAANGTAGTIGIVGDNISIGDSAAALITRVAASGLTPGSVSIGAGPSGSILFDRSIPTTVTVNAAGRIEADGFGTANGGRINLSSNRFASNASANIFGKLYARSGLQGGNGGVIELGGHLLRVEDNARLDTTASAIGGNVRLIGTRIDVDTNPSTLENPVGIFAWGVQGGGTINVGAGEGGFPIGNPVASNVNIGPTSRFNANAIEAGVGGTITIWTRPNDPVAVTVLGGSLAVDSPETAGTIEVGGYDIRFGALQASALGTDGTIGIAERIGYGSGYGYGYGSFAEGGSVSLLAGAGASIFLDGEFETLSGDFTVSAGDDASITLAGFLGTGGANSTIGGDVTLTAGDRSDIVTSGFFTTSGGHFTATVGNGNVENVSRYINDGFVDTSLVGGVGGNFTVTAGNDSFSEIVGEIFTGGGNILISHGANSLIDIGISQVPDCLECSFGSGYLDADFGDVELNADAIGIAPGSSSLASASSFEIPINIFGDDIRLNADSVDIFGRVLATNSIAVAPRTVNRSINIGGIEDSPAALSLEEFELDNIDAPNLVFGRADGTGAINIVLTDDMDDSMSPSMCDGETQCFEDSPSTTTVKAGGVGGTITLSGTGTSGDLETIRLVAGSNITLAQGFSLEIDGKLELVSGGSFTNNAGAGALTTAGDGQWLVYSATPSADVFGGLLSGQKALWGQDFAAVSANGIAHSGNLYAFGLAPTATVTAVNRTKTYGDTLDLSAPLLGRDYSVSGLIDAAQFGGVFTQDSLTGAPTLASSGVAGTADAGSYTITAATGVGLSAGNGYNLAFQGGSLTVDPRLLTAGLLGNVSKVYDGSTAATLGSANYSLAGFVNGDEAAVAVATTSGSYDSKDAGTGKTVTVAGVALTGAKAGNYVLNATTLSGAVGTVTPKTLTAALTGSVQKVYDATTAAALSAANYSLDGFVSGEGATVSQTSGSFTSPNVGSGLVVTASLDATSLAAASGTSLGNYLLPTLASGAIGTITPATLTYVADPATRTQNAANPALTGNVAGLLGGDTLANATSGTLAFTTPAVIDSPVGAYAINGGGLTAGNYVFTQAPGNATALQVTATPAMQPAQQITTTVIQQVTNSSRTPTPTPAPVPVPTPPPAGPGGPTPNTGPGGLTGPVTGAPPTPPPPPPPPPPPTPSSSGAGGNPPPPPPGPAVEATPPSPVGDTAPETPSDSADQGDPVLAEAGAEEEQDEAPSEKRQSASTTVVVPGVNVEVPTPARAPEVPGADQSFSGSGNPAQW